MDETSIRACGIKSCIHSQTSTVVPLKFGNGYVISSHTLMAIWLLIHAGIKVNHWDRVTHICVSRLTIISSDNCLSPVRRQAIIWTNADILVIGPLEINFSEILIEIYTFPFRKMHLKTSSGKWRPFVSALMYNQYHTFYIVWIHEVLCYFTKYRRPFLMVVSDLRDVSPKHQWGNQGFYRKHVSISPADGLRFR